MSPASQPLCPEPTPAIAPAWFQRSAVAVAPDLIGCILVRNFADGQLWRSLIVEVEAYAPGDPACHAYRRRTARNDAMFRPGGTAYVYLIYGMYHCLNIVTDQADVGSAVLIRAIAIEPLPPWTPVKEQAKPHRVAAGPGKLCRLLHIDLALNGTELAQGAPLWLEHRPPQWQNQLQTGNHRLIQTTRIGLTQGTELPWRWYLADCPAVSKPLKITGTIHSQP